MFCVVNISTPDNNHGGDEDSIAQSATMAGASRRRLRAVRTWCGVIEHPRYSRAWRAFGIQRPAGGGGWQRLVCGGWTCEVWQGRYGGRVPKPTWLYYYQPARVSRLGGGGRAAAVGVGGRRRVR